MAEEEGKSEVDEFLDNTFRTKKQVPVVVPKYQKNRLSKIEKAGDVVVEHLYKLAKETDLSYQQMASRMNELYQLDLSKQNVVHFFRSNAAVMEALAEEQKSLNQIRAKIYLEHHGVLLKDIKMLDERIEKVKESEFMAEEKKSKLIGDLVDKKGKLMIRYGRLTGQLKDEKVHVGDNVVNIIQDKVHDEKSDIIQRLKKAEFHAEIIDVTPNEDEKTDSAGLPGSAQ